MAVDLEDDRVARITFNIRLAALHKAIHVAICGGARCEAARWLVDVRSEPRSASCRREFREDDAHCTNR